MNSHTIETEIEQSSPVVTICICHYNRLSKLKSTIEHLRENTNEEYKLKIFNDGYVDGEIREYLSGLEEDRGATVIYSEKNVGPVAGRKKLLTDIDTPFTMTLDDDMYVDQNWLTNAIDIFQSNENIGLIGYLFSSTTDKSITDTREISVENNVLRLKNRRLTKEDNNSEFTTHTIVDEVPTGAMIFRSEVLNIFEFDPNYKIGFGDIDKTLQLQQSKWGQAICMENQFTHDKKTKQTEYTKGGRYLDLSESYRYFIEKWNIRYPLYQHLKFKYIYNIYGRSRNFI